MTALGVGLRLAVLAAALAGLAPLQALAIRRGWPLAGKLPSFVHRLFLRLFEVRVVVEGRPPAGAPTLVLANHVSWLDIPVLGGLGPLSFIAKSEIAGWPMVGLLAKLQRTIFIDRARKTHTAEVNAEVGHRLAQGDVIVLFPEGTTSDGNRVLPFRSSLVGAARAALAEPTLQRIHLQPLAITYTRRQGMPVTRRERPAIAWYGDMDLIPHARAFLREGALDALVVWGEPVVFDGASDRKRAALAAEAAVRSAIRRAGRGCKAPPLGAPSAGAARTASLPREPSLSAPEPVKENVTE